MITFDSIVTNTIEKLIPHARGVQFRGDIRGRAVALSLDSTVASSDHDARDGGARDGAARWTTRNRAEDDDARERRVEGGRDDARVGDADGGERPRAVAQV